MELSELLITPNWYLIICAGVALVLGVNAVVLLLMALFPGSRPRFLRPGPHTYTSPSLRPPVPGKAGLYSVHEP